MKVLYLDGSMKFGGAAKSLCLVLTRMRSAEPVLATCQEDDVTGRWLSGRKIYRIRRAFHYLARLGLEDWLRRRVGMAWASRAIRKLYAIAASTEQLLIMARLVVIARRHNARLIHLNTGFATLGGIAVARLLGIPCVVHLRGFMTSKRKWIGRNMKFAAHVIGVSRAVSQSAIDRGVPAENVTTVYDPVDVEAFDWAIPKRAETRSALGLNEGEVAVGIFGRIIPWKGQLEFVRAAEEAMAVRQDLRAVLVGDASDGLPEYFDQVRAAIRDSPYRDRFVVAGYREDVERYYCAMDVVVHASVEPEPFGMVIAEAMAAGKPVIATRPGGPAEIVDPGVDGILVEPGDVGQMAAAVLELAADPAKRARMGERGYRKARERYTVAGAASQVQSVYERVLAPRRRAAP